MKILFISALAFILAAPAFAGDETPRPQPQSQPQPKPAVDMDELLQELRDLDSSRDMGGDHAVGEEIC